MKEYCVTSPSCSAHAMTYDKSKDPRQTSGVPHHNDPVFQADDGKWWYWIENWADKNGPFDTESEARTDLQKYCEELGIR